MSKGSEIPSCEEEMPWRSGTATFSAKRSQVLTVLSPLRLIPRVDIPRASVVARKQAMKPASQPDSLQWECYAAVTIIPTNTSVVIIPLRQCSALLDVDGIAERLESGRMELTKTDVPLIEASESSIIVRAPGTITLHWYSYTVFQPSLPETQLKMSLSMRPVDDERVIIAEATLPVIPRKKQIGSWQLGTF